MDCVIGCDVGSQSVKAVLLSVEGQLVGEARAGYAIEYPHPTWAEQSAEVWLTAITQAVGALRASTGVAPDHIRAIGLDAQVDGVVGGGARSQLWRQIKADVTGLPVALPQTTETTALGAAMLALVGAGACESLAPAAESTVRIVEIIDPRPETQARYEDDYQLYRSTYFALLPVFEQAARLPAP